MQLPVIDSLRIITYVILSESEFISCSMYMLTRSTSGQVPDVATGHLGPDSGVSHLEIVIQIGKCVTLAKVISVVIG